MSFQNINQNQFKNFYLKLNNENLDLSLVSDVVNFDEEIIFSNEIIGDNDGKTLPIKIDFNSNKSIFTNNLIFGQYNEDNVIISENYIEYDGCLTGNTICDIGLTGIDNGFTDGMTGKTILITNDVLDDSLKFQRNMFDRRMKFFQVTGHTGTNNRFSGNTGNTTYDIITKTGITEGVYQEFYGGFYQGFYKLFGYDYSVIPDRTENGWTIEFLMKPRLSNDFVLSGNNKTLNDYYPANNNTFFFIGARAENKFYHYASKVGSGSTMRITDGLECIKTCACGASGVTNSVCIPVYPPTGYTSELVNGPCEAQTIETPNPEKLPLMDSLSNAMSFRLCGDPSNPSIGIKVLKYTGSCEPFDICENTGNTLSTGYTVTEYCTDQIYKCLSGSSFTELEHWILVSVVFERDFPLSNCDLYNIGGLGLISKTVSRDGMYGSIVSLISPPITHDNSEIQELTITELNEEWLANKKYRNGKLKIFVNGYLIDTIEDFEEIIPRQLNDEKERQVGVPFNISIGGGTQGLHESLTFMNCTDLNGPYQQDPELLSEVILNNSSFSGLTNGLKLDENFAGNFNGAIAQFRMYIKPLTSAQIQHNFRILKPKFSLFDFFCDKC